MTVPLSAEDLATYDRSGYLVTKHLIPPADVATLATRLREYTHGGRDATGLAIQVEPRVARGEMAVDHPGDGIRKIDYLVQNDDLYRRLGLHESIVGVLEQVLGPDIKMFRNSMMLKPPEVGSQKGWHQDSPYWPIEPMALCSCWFPLDDATLENGCMVVLPGWHNKGSLPHVNVTDDYVIPAEHLAGGEPLSVPMQAGSGLFFHSLLPHYTAPNRSKAWRRAIALSYMSSRSRYTGDGESPVYYPVQGQTYPGCVR